MITLVQEKLIAKNKWITLYFDEVQFPNGDHGYHNRLIEGDGSNGIVIIPVDNEGRIGFVNLYRYPLARYMWELPRGFGESQSIEEEAKRELIQEMGFQSNNIKLLGTLASNSGISSSLTNIVIASELDCLDSGNPEDSEAIVEKRFFSLDEIANMAHDGIMLDGFSLSAIMLAVFQGYLKY